MPSDYNATTHLREAMVAATAHDLAALNAALNAAQQHLRPQHPSLRDIDTATTAATTGNWPLAWDSAWRAIAGLSTGFPPDPAVCGPRPTDTPLDPRATPVCTLDPAHGPHLGTATFCHQCGTRLDRTPATTASMDNP